MMGLLKSLPAAALAAGLLTGLANQSFAEESDLYGGPGDYLAGSAAMAQGDYDIAHKHFQQLVELEPDNTDILKTALDAALYTGQIGAAADIARALDDFERERTLYNFIYIADAVQNGDMEKAMEIVQWENRGRPNPPDSIPQVADEWNEGAKSADTKWKQMVLAQLALALNPDQTEAKLLIADLHIENDKLDAALDYLDETVTGNDPFYFDVHAKRALVLAFTGEYDIATEILSDLAAEAEDPEKWNEIVYLHAGITDIAGDHDSSITLYTQLIDRMESRTEADLDLLSDVYTARAVNYDRAGRWAQAEQDFRKAIEYNPEHSGALNYLGYSLIEKGDNKEEALEMITSAYNLTGGRDGHIADSYGWALYHFGRYDEAVTILENAATLMPTFPEIAFHLGESYAAAGRDREARWQWKHTVDMAEELYPDDPRQTEIAAQARQRLAPQSGLALSPTQ